MVCKQVRCYKYPSWFKRTDGMKDADLVYHWSKNSLNDFMTYSGATYQKRERVWELCFTWITHSVLIQQSVQTEQAGRQQYHAVVLLCHYNHKISGFPQFYLGVHGMRMLLLLLKNQVLHMARQQKRGADAFFMRLKIPRRLIGVDRLPSASHLPEKFDIVDKLIGRVS